MAIFATTLLWMICGAAGLVACVVREDSQTQSILIGVAAIAGGFGIVTLLLAASN